MSPAGTMAGNSNNNNNNNMVESSWLKQQPEHKCQCYFKADVPVIQRTHLSSCLNQDSSTISESIGPTRTQDETIDGQIG